MKGETPTTIDQKASWFISPKCKWHRRICITVIYSTWVLHLTIASEVKVKFESLRLRLCDRVTIQWWSTRKVVSMAWSWFCLHYKLWQKDGKLPRQPVKWPEFRGTRSKFKMLKLKLNSHSRLQMSCSVSGPLDQTTLQWYLKYLHHRLYHWFIIFWYLKRDNQIFRHPWRWEYEAVICCIIRQLYIYQRQVGCQSNVSIGGHQHKLPLK